jgi:hypothetical protein
LVEKNTLDHPISDGFRVLSRAVLNMSACARCTFKNAAGVLACAMCGIVSNEGSDSADPAAGGSAGSGDFCFGLIADTQYVDRDDGSNFDRTVVRRYRQSLDILTTATRSFTALAADPSANFGTYTVAVD